MQELTGEFTQTVTRETTWQEVASQEVTSQEITWTRVLAAGSLIASAALLLTGRRKAALIATGIGAVAVLAEDPQALREMWNRAPEYLQDGREMLGRMENVVEDLTAQGGRVKQLWRRA